MPSPHLPRSLHASQGLLEGALTFAIIKGSDLTTNTIISGLLFLLGVVWNDKACLLRAISVLIEYQSHSKSLDVTDLCIFEFHSDLCSLVNSSAFPEEAAPPG